MKGKRLRGDLNKTKDGERSVDNGQTAVLGSGNSMCKAREVSQEMYEGWGGMDERGEECEAMRPEAAGARCCVVTTLVKYHGKYHWT